MAHVGLGGANQERIFPVLADDTADSPRLIGVAGRGSSPVTFEILDLMEVEREREREREGGDGER